MADISSDFIFISRTPEEEPHVILSRDANNSLNYYYTTYNKITRLPEKMKFAVFILLCIFAMTTVMIDLAAANEESQLESSDENGGRNLTESQEDLENGRAFTKGKFARKRKLYAPKSK
ncbi:unnamed protein product [Orchesella dallaii]|uniref:Uncharacterized protein n=1 Tax=Orchesella dallaii TaxID=48710 RepID=A0ABP1Q476_9HEXA